MKETRDNPASPRRTRERGAQAEIVSSPFSPFETFLLVGDIQAEGNSFSKSYERSAKSGVFTSKMTFSGYLGQQ
jgi:hypothetical protein